MTPNSSKLFLLILIPTFFIIFDYYKKEPFLNMEKKYKKIKRGMNVKLEGMIKRLPAKIYLRRGIKRLKHKFISY